MAIICGRLLLLFILNVVIVKSQWPNDFSNGFRSSSNSEMDDGEFLNPYLYIDTDNDGISETKVDGDNNLMSAWSDVDADTRALLNIARLEDLVDEAGDDNKKNLNDARLDDYFEEESENRDLEKPSEQTEQSTDESPFPAEDAEDSVTSDSKKERGTRRDTVASVSENENDQVDKKLAKDSEAPISKNEEQELKSLLAELEDSQINKASKEADSVKYKTSSTNSIEMKIQLPGVSVSQDDTYLCSSIKIDNFTTKKGKPIYITKYIPHAKETIAHHMLLYGCVKPGMKKPGAVWNCGGLMEGTKKIKYPSADICGGGQSTILWAWAKNAPAFSLPKDIGFKVGDNTNVNYLVLQVHYKSASVFKGGKKDYSSVTVVASETRMPRLAGVYVLATSVGTVPPHQTKNFDIYCEYLRTFVIHPFAFRTHTHALGLKVLGYRIRDGHWKLIGAKNPQLPQAFYSVANKNMTIRYGDILAARCVMHNFRNIPTKIGSKHTDEMCNFYIMFWTDAKNEAKLDKWVKSCGNGYPWIHWSSLPGYGL